MLTSEGTSKIGLNVFNIKILIEFVKQRIFLSLSPSKNCKSENYIIVLRKKRKKRIVNALSLMFLIPSIKLWFWLLTRYYLLKVNLKPQIKNSILLNICIKA